MLPILADNFLLFISRKKRGWWPDADGHWRAASWDGPIWDELTRPGELPHETSQTTAGVQHAGCHHCQGANRYKQGYSWLAHHEDRQAFLTNLSLEDTDSYQDVVVEIERATRGKAFLGGYRHKVTKAEYHHAAVQTMPKKRPDKGVEIFSRDTQVCAHTYTHIHTHIYTHTHTIHTIKWIIAVLDYAKPLSEWHLIKPFKCTELSSLCLNFYLH